jgi:Protein phosphatase 2C
LGGIIGDRVAKYAGENVHRIVRKQESFDKEDYVKALEDGFVATDSALMGGACEMIEHRADIVRIDGHYEDEPSGCTATVALITEKNVLYVVCLRLFVDLTNPGECRRFTHSSWQEGTSDSIVKGS